MATQIKDGETKNAPVPVPPKPALTVGGAPAALVPRDIDQAWRLAQIIANADMAPKSYNKDPNRIMVGILHGLEVGLTPMAALQSIAVINGTPSVWGDGALALVQASGLLMDISEAIQGDGDQRVAVCTLTRKNRENATTRRFSVADAKLAGLWGKAGPWIGYPQRMLQMRARSWALRDCFPDVLKGMGVAEETQDIERLHIGQDGAYVIEPKPTRDQFIKPAAKADDAKIEGPKPEPKADAKPPAQPEQKNDEAEQQDAGKEREYELYDHNGELESEATAKIWALKLVGLCDANPDQRSELISANEHAFEVILSDLDKTDTGVAAKLRALIEADKAGADATPAAEPTKPQPILMPKTPGGAMDVSAYIKAVNLEIGECKSIDQVRSVLEREKPNRELLKPGPAKILISRAAQWARDNGVKNEPDWS